MTNFSIQLEMSSTKFVINFPFRFQHQMKVENTGVVREGGVDMFVTNFVSFGKRPFMGGLRREEREGWSSNFVTIWVAGVGEDEEVR